MAVKKATTKADLTGPEPASVQDRVDAIAELSTPDMLVDVKAPKSVKVKSPTGAVTEVPEDIKDALVESGYSVVR